MIELDAIHKTFGDTEVLHDLSLKIETGELAVLIGPSGSGKSTTLKLLNRLLDPDRGCVRLHGEDIRRQAPEQLRRKIGYAIQSVGLFPHWTVEQNIAVVPELQKWPRTRIRERVAELLVLLDMPPAQFLHRYPHQISGGQQQRVGVARALAADPEFLLMDEPFGALDPVTRANLQDELLRIHRLLGKTIVLVTHDLDEAIRLGSRIVIMDQGRIVQQGPAREILLTPANAFVRDFVKPGEIGVRLLGLARVSERVRWSAQATGEALGLNATLREALSAFILQGVACLPVADESGRHVGALHFDDLLEIRA
jgi:osmoprotectant transport system ATP-binding protein